MKKINIISILLSALILASSCNRDEAGLNPPEQNGRTVTITASPAQTKTALVGGAVHWEDEDEIDLVLTHDTDAPSVNKFSTSLETTSVTASFVGQLPTGIYREDSGYDEIVKAVYPSGIVNADGDVEFTLPSEQRVRADGTFAARLNLSSASVSLADIKDDGNASATFRNALSILRFTLQDDVTSVTLTGTSPLAGKAPLTFTAEGDDAGRLVVDGEWAENDKSMSVTLKPADGSECFPGGEVNMLVWPGTHTSISVTVNFKEYGEFSKSKTLDFEFLPSRYYTLNLNADSEEIVTDITDKIADLDGDLGALESRLEALETTAEKISLLLDQIQSVSLATEYLNNEVYASYAPASIKYVLKPISLDYVVRPARAMELLLDVCSEEGNLSEVLSAKLTYDGSSLSDMTVTEAVLEGDVLSVTVDASSISRDFYDGNTPAAAALEISDGNTEILSDFATLVPKKGLVLSVSKSKGLPAMPGSTMSFQFECSAVNIANVTAKIENVRGFSSTPTVTLNSYNGTVRADFTESDDISAMSFNVVLKDSSTGETESVEFTFEDVGKLTVECPAAVDYVGGEVHVDVYTPDNGHEYSDPTMWLQGNVEQIQYYSKSITNENGVVISTQYYHYDYVWVSETSSGHPGDYTVSPNQSGTFTVAHPDNSEQQITGTYNESQAERTFTVTVKVETVDRKYSYQKSASVTQSANGAPINPDLYYADGYVEVLQEATAGGNHLNVVILGDGYQKKDLVKGGKFRRSAVSAYGAFFGVAPFRDFRDRFNVYMVTYESENEGPRLSSLSESEHSTCFGTYYHGGNDTYVNCSDTYKAKIRDIVTGKLHLTGSDLYRTVVIMLVNTSENIGSTVYYPQDTISGSDDPGDGYATFSIALLAANNTATSGLIRHEAGGHGFGRLGDEYAEYEVSNVQSKHSIGFYRNIALDTSYWSAFTAAGYGEDEVMYDLQHGSDAAGTAVYRSTPESGIMWNNNGNFNAVSRHLIYERIIKQTEGPAAYSWKGFLEYDSKNR